MVVFVAVTMLMLAIMGLLVLAARQTAILHAEITTRNLAKALEQHTARTMGAIDQLLRDVVARIEAAPDDPGNLQAVQAMLASRVKTLPQVRALFVFDANGAAILDSDSVSPRLLQVADRDYFTTLRDSGRKELFIGSPVWGRASGTWTLIPSRRINRPDGSFFGVATATLDLDYFQNFFATLDVGEQGAIGLFHANGKVVFRAPADPNIIGRDFSRTELFRNWLNAASGTYRATSAIDGISRVISYDQVDSLPLLVTVALSEREILASWRKQASYYFVITLIGGVVIALFGWWLSREVRRREAAEASSSKQAAIFQTMLACMPDAVQLLDENARLVSSNDQLFAIMDLDKDVITASADPHRAFLEAMASRGDYGEGDVDGLIESRLALIRSSDPVEYRRQLASGKWIECRRRRIPNGGSIALFRDVSSEVAQQQQVREAHQRVREAVAAADRSRAEAVEASRAKSEFLAGMSHELRTPLNAILGFSEIISNLTFGRGALDKYREYAGDIQTSGQHLLSLINDILDLAKVEAGKMDLYEEAFELEPMLRGSIGMVRESAQAGGLELCLRAPEAAIVLNADMRKIKQSVLNLLSNAIKFTPHGGSVMVTAAVTAAGITVEVADTGIGIRPEDKKRVYQKFAQVDSYITRERAGTGLGIPLTNAFIELHGGKLLLESTPGVGTIATLQLPRSRLVANEPERLIA